MEYWKKRTRLELEIIIEEIWNRREGVTSPRRDLNDVHRFLKEAMEDGVLAWDKPNPEGGGPYRKSRIAYVDLHKYAEAIADQEIIGFCEAWAEGSSVWDAIRALSAPQAPDNLTVSLKRGRRPGPYVSVLEERISDLGSEEWEEWRKVGEGGRVALAEQIWRQNPSYHDDFPLPEDSRTLRKGVQTAWQNACKRKLRAPS
jgi:hypothetical protein